MGYLPARRAADRVGMQQTLPRIPRLARADRAINLLDCGESPKPYTRMAYETPNLYPMHGIRPRPARNLTVADLARLWRISPAITSNAGARGFGARLAFMVASVRHRSVLVPMLHSGGALGRVLARRPETVGSVVWPYVCLSWDAGTRLSRIRDHWSAVEGFIPALNFPPDEEHELLELSSLMPGLRIVLDQPKWFMREGQAVLNLFIGETRVLSLAFSLRREEALTAYIGAVQGRNIEGALDTYKLLTGALHGMRPRDFLIDLFRTLCITIGVKRICAVSECSRHHRSPYFGKKWDSQASVDYDSIWQDRGGLPLNPDFYSLPVEPPRRSIDDVASKKRSMYRKRYEMLERVETQLRAALSSKGEQRDERQSTLG